MDFEPPIYIFKNILNTFYILEEILPSLIYYDLLFQN